MKTIQMTINEPLLAEVDRVSHILEINRSASIREALRLALQRQKIIEMERQQAEGYAQHPVQPNEFITPESDQVWGEP